MGKPKVKEGDVLRATVPLGHNVPSSRLIRNRIVLVKNVKKEGGYYKFKLQHIGRVIDYHVSVETFSSLFGKITEEELFHECDRRAKALYEAERALNKIAELATTDWQGRIEE